MNDLIKIGNQNISVKEFNNQRVITFKDIDSVHERPEGTARKRFNDNKKRFINGTDFFVITAPSEIRTLGIERPQGGTPEKVTLITESGYLMIVKSLTDDLAWDVQRQLVDSYFRKVKPLSQVEMMRIQLGMIDDHENHIVNLENNMTLDYGQQKALEGVVNKTVIDVLDGKNSNAYKGIGRKVFAECNGDLKRYFNVNARNNIPKKRFEEAIEYAKNWRPCTNTMILISDYNAQINL